MDDNQFQTGLREFVDPAGVHHEAFKNNFVRHPELRQRFDDLFRSRWPEPELTPPSNPGKPGTIPAPQPEPSTPKPPAENWVSPPAELTDEKLSRDDYAVAEEHLKHEWGNAYEQNWKLVEAGRDSVFNKADPGDELVYHKVLGSPLRQQSAILESAPRHRQRTIGH
jgi:hypothetical protein